MKNEFNFYNTVRNWDFSMIKCEEEYLTNWNMYVSNQQNSVYSF